MSIDRLLCTEFHQLVRRRASKEAALSLSQAKWLQDHEMVMGLLDYHLSILDGWYGYQDDTLLLALRDPRAHWEAVLKHILDSLLQKAIKDCGACLLSELAPDNLLISFRHAHARACQHPEGMQLRSCQNCILQIVHTHTLPHPS